MNRRRHWALVASLTGGLLAGAGLGDRIGMAGAATTQRADSLWALSFTTGPGWRPEIPPAQQAGFGSHSRNLARLRADGRILMGGRYGAVGLMLLRAAGAEEVRAWLAPDSAVAQGVFTAEIVPWRTVYDGVVPRQ